MSDTERNFCINIVWVILPTVRHFSCLFLKILSMPGIEMHFLHKFSLSFSLGDLPTVRYFTWLLFTSFSMFYLTVLGSTFTDYFFWTNSYHSLLFIVHVKLAKYILVEFNFIYVITRSYCSLYCSKTYSRSQLSLMTSSFLSLYDFILHSFFTTVVFFHFNVKNLETCLMLSSGPYLRDIFNPDLFQSILHLYVLSNFKAQISKFTTETQIGFLL